MDLEQEDKICALCKFNKDIESNFFCGNLNQPNIKFRHQTKYNDTCELFEEKEERKDIYIE